MTGPFTAFNFRVSITLGDQSTDPLCDAQEPAYNEWYESHHPVSLARAGGYQRLTRYVATDPRPWQNKYLTVY